MFDGNDTTINQIAFGDGVLDVCDVYVTFRRSLDPTLTWFRRFWTNGVRVAETTPNYLTPSVVCHNRVIAWSVKCPVGDSSHQRSHQHHQPAQGHFYRR